MNNVKFGHGEIAAVWMILWGRSSDRTGERVWHNTLPLAWVALAVVGVVCVLTIGRNQPRTVAVPS